MKRWLEVLIHGIPDWLYVECSSCLFWRGALFGALVVTSAVGACWVFG